MTEPEIARLYEQRAVRTGGVPAPRDLLEPAKLLPDIPDLRITSLTTGYGQIRLAVRPAAPDASLPESPWLDQPLRQAIAESAARQGQRISQSASPRLWDALNDWRPRGTVGWVAGSAGRSPESLQLNVGHAAVLAYLSHLVVEVTLPLAIGPDGKLPYRCAYEWLVAVELMAALSFAGELFSEVSGAGLLHCAIQLAGFKDAVPFYASKAHPGVSVDHLPKAPSGITNALIEAALSFRDEPEEIGRALIDRWLVSFYQGRDLFSTVAPS